MIDAGPFALVWFAASDIGAGTLFKILVLLAIVVVSVINTGVKKAKALAAARERKNDPSAPRVETVRAQPRDREQFRNAQALANSVRKANPPPPPKPPTPTRAPRPKAVRVRRKGLVDDAHVNVGEKLPTSDDMPGAHSAHDHVHLTEIGADRGTAEKHMGAHPSTAATVKRRTAISGHALLRSTDLKGKDRVRAGILWAEVFGPPRSRARR